MGTIIALWWMFLIVAVVVTAVDVILLARVIRAAQAIAFLTKRTLPAAQNIATHTATITKLDDTKAVAGEMLAAVEPLAAVAASIRKHIDPVMKKVRSKG